MESPSSSRHKATNASVSVGQHAGLLRLHAGVDLHEQTRSLADIRNFLCESASEFWPVDGLDDVEQGNRLAHFVRLQRPDEM